MKFILNRVSSKIILRVHDVHCFDSVSLFYSSVKYCFVKKKIMRCQFCLSFILRSFQSVSDFSTVIK